MLYEVITESDAGQTCALVDGSIPRRLTDLQGSFLIRFNAKRLKIARFSGALSFRIRHSSSRKAISSYNFV